MLSGPEIDGVYPATPGTIIGDYECNSGEMKLDIVNVEEKSSGMSKFTVY